MMRKLGKDDETRIMLTIKKLPTYVDFKDLYNKTVPEISKFEKKIYEHYI